MSDFSDEEPKAKKICRKPKPKKSSQANGELKYDFFDMSAKHSSMVEIIDENLLAVEQPIVIDQDDDVELIINEEKNYVNTSDQKNHATSNSNDISQGEIITVEDLQESTFKRDVTPPPADDIEISGNSKISQSIKQKLTLIPIDTDQIDLTNNHEITISVKHEPKSAKIRPFKFKLWSHYPLKEVFNQVAKRRKVDVSNVVLMFENIRIYPSTLPNTVGMCNGSIISILA